MHGEGQVLAQCGDAMLVAFADGDRCLQAGQMLLERDRTPDARTAPPSAQPLPPEAAACVPGSEIWHRKYGRGRIVFDAPQCAVTPGQAAVFYDGNTVLGGGTIE